jgi:hypothetical protein
MGWLVLECIFRRAVERSIYCGAYAEAPNPDRQTYSLYSVETLIVFLVIVKGTLTECGILRVGSLAFIHGNANWACC